MSRVRLKIKSKVRLKINKKEAEEEEVCYVCKKQVHPILKKGSAIDVSNNWRYKSSDGILARHGGCAIGSFSWLKSDVAKTSKFYRYYQKQIEEIKKENKS